MPVSVLPGFYSTSVMTTHTPTEDSAWGLDRALSFLSTFANNGPLHVKTLMEGPTNLYNSASHGYQNLVSSLKSTYTNPGSLAPQEGAALGSPSGNVQTVVDFDQASTSTVTTSNNPFTSAARAPEATSQIVRGGEARDSFPKSNRTCRNRTGLWITAFIVGVLSLVLIVVPGLTLGLVTGQLPWGIALSGTIVTVCGFYGGPVYTIISAGQTEESHVEEIGEEIV